MAFKTPFTNLTETEERERARLADAPVGSISHYLSTLPETIHERPEGLLIELPWAPPRTEEQYRVVVVPFKFHADSGASVQQPRQRNSSYWDCIIVWSHHPSYPVGGYRINVSSVELARGKKITL